MALLGVRPAPAQAPETFGPATIDHLIRAEWKQAGITPAPPVDDARYLRRVYLDITGTLPTADAVTAFLNNKSPYKRFEVVNHLLDSPEYTDHWTDYWYSILMGRGMTKGRIVDTAAFRDWVKTEFSKNTPYNQFVYDLLTATGQNGSGQAYNKVVAAVQARNQAGLPNMKKNAKTMKMRRQEPVIAYDPNAPKPTMQSEGGRQWRAAMRP